MITDEIVTCFNINVLKPRELQRELERYSNETTDFTGTFQRGTLQFFESPHHDSLKIPLQTTNQSLRQCGGYDEDTKTNYTGATCCHAGFICEKA